MSKRSWGRSLIDILRQLGVPIDKQTEDVIEQERAAAPEVSTADIVSRLSLAPPDVMAQAVNIAKEEGSMDLLIDRYAQARATVKRTQAVTAELARSAEAIAKK